VFNSFTLETILAAAFGRSIDIQRGEADELTKAVKNIFVLFQEGQKMSLDMILMLYSMSSQRYRVYNIRSYCKSLSCLLLGHLSYSWCVTTLRFAMKNSKAGEKMFKVEEVILNLIKARRESDNPEKV
jgi:hypothetical protein